MCRLVTTVRRTVCSVIEALNASSRRGRPLVQYGNEWLQELGEISPNVGEREAKPTSPEWGQLSEI